MTEPLAASHLPAIQWSLVLALAASIVPWRQLSEPEQQKDRDTILRIPMLLQTLANRQNCS